MTTRKLHHDQTPKFLYLGGGGDSGDQGFEMNESDVWNIDHDHLNEHQNLVPRRTKFPLKAHQQRKVAMSARSMPVNIPDWSAILRDECKHHGRRNNYDDDVGFDGDDNENMLPPHEYLARTRIASFSVHEGVGRTLKGRDLSRVRNAIWKQTGFEQD
ncbi:protein S40-4-like [Bidens hawaiensis]|uniref:protein S40-4-like n=1 Tax=Bidens hawaiensis TaxID=980011 RepID=UPI00404AAB7C